MSIHYLRIQMTIRICLQMHGEAWPTVDIEFVTVNEGICSTSPSWFFTPLFLLIHVLICYASAHY